MSDPTGDLLDVMFAAIERGDIDAVGELFADDVEVWHNVTRVALDKEGCLALLRYWSSRVSGMRYEVLERRTYDGGAMQRHVIHGRADGEVVDAPVCIVFHLDGGLVTRIFEYLDAAAVSAVFG